MRKLSESMWADAHRKNIGVEVRKEDVYMDKFYFCNNHATSFKGNCPSIVKNDVDCHNTHCTSLEGVPRIVDGEFTCSNTQSLVSLKGCPRKIGGDFNFYSTSITEIDDFPDEIGGSINMSGCKNLKNFVGMLNTVNDDLDIGYCIIDSIDGLPSDIKGKMIIGHISYRDTYEKNKKMIDDLKKEINDIDHMRSSPKRKEMRNKLNNNIDRICDNMMYDVYYDIIKKHPHLKGKIYKSRFDGNSL